MTRGGDECSDSGGASCCHRYVAITNSDEIAFVTLGDWGCGPDNCRVPSTAPEGFHHGGLNQLKVAKAMAKAAAAIGSKFVLALGDNFYWGGVNGPTDPLWKTVWLDRFKEESLQTPWYAILGNHDHYGNAEAQIDFSRKKLDCGHFKQCPSRWVLPRYWYSVVVPSESKKFDVQFVFIDTVILAEGSSKQLAEEKIHYGTLGKEYMAKWQKWAEQRKAMAKVQLEWFENTLNTSTADWLIGEAAPFSPIPLSPYPPTPYPRPRPSPFPSRCLISCSSGLSRVPIRADWTASSSPLTSQTWVE